MPFKMFSSGLRPLVTVLVEVMHDRDEDPLLADKDPGPPVPDLRESVRRDPKLWGSPPPSPMGDYIIGKIHRWRNNRWPKIQRYKFH